MQQDKSLYAFLKKNAAYSTGTRSCKKESDIDSMHVEDGKVQSFNTPQHHNFGNQYVGSAIKDNDLDDRRTMYTFNGGRETAKQLQF